MAAAGRSRRVNFRISLALTAELRNILILPLLSEEFRLNGKKIRKKECDVDENSQNVDPRE